MHSVVLFMGGSADVSLCTFNVVKSAGPTCGGGMLFEHKMVKKTFFHSKSL